MDNNRLCCLLLCTSILYGPAALADDQNYWECEAHDKASQTWTNRHYYQLSALNKALAACKKSSTVPKTCKTSRADCDHIVNGRSTRPLWQCSSIDSQGVSWKSNLYPQRDDAALAAKAYCQQNSKKPSTCLVEFLTCKNVNALFMQ